MANRLEVISARLLNSLMGANRGVSSGPCEIFAVLVRNVFALRVFVALCQSKINDEDLIFLRVGSTDQEVVWLDVPVDDSLFMDFLNAHQLRQIWLRFKPFNLNLGFKVRDLQFHMNWSNHKIGNRKYFS